MTDARLKFPAELSGFAFGDVRFDRSDALRDDADALRRLWPLARVIVLQADGGAFADEAGQLLAVTGAMLGSGPGTAVFLGLQGEQAWFSIDAEVLPLAAPRSVDLRSAAAAWPVAESSAFAFARAMQH